MNEISRSFIHTDALGNCLAENSGYSVNYCITS